MNTIKAIMRVVAAIYISIGVLLLLFHPRLDTDERLTETATGKKGCEVDSVVLLTLGWPYFLKYYYGGGFDVCRKSSFKH